MNINDIRKNPTKYLFKKREHNCEGAIIKIFDDFPELLLKIKTFIIECPKV